MAILFQTEEIDFKVPQPARVKAWLKLVVEKEKKKTGDLDFVFMDDKALLLRNQQFLSHDYFTDIITFDYTQGDKVSGDILISIDRVKENSKSFGVEFGSELRRVMVHGVLHLCGYKDKSTRQKEIMRTMEDKYLRLFERTFNLKK